MYKNKFYSKKDLSEGAADAAKGQMIFFGVGSYSQESSVAKIFRETWHNVDFLSLCAIFKRGCHINNITLRSKISPKNGKVDDRNRSTKSTHTYYYLSIIR